MSRGRARATPAVAGWVAALAALALLALGALFALDRMYRADMLRITAVDIHGLQSRRVDAGQVREAVQGALPATYFSVDLAAIEARIAALPWVFSAKLRRRWPDTLSVEVTEVQPVAAWGRAHWLHASGALVAKPANADAGEWRDLPRLSGPGGAGGRAGSRAAVWRAYQTWSKAFAAKGLHLDELHADARGLFYLALSVSALVDRGGDAGEESPPIRLVVPADVADARIARFTRALRHPALGGLAGLRAVDLRYPNGFAVSRAPATAATVTAAESPTVAEAR